MHSSRNLTALPLRILTMIFLFIAAANVHAENSLQSLKFSSLPNDQIQLSFQFSEAPSEPLAFTIDNPARIALDFAGTNNQLAKRFQEIGIGVARSVNTAEAKGRTRIVVNLSRMEDYQTKISGNNLILTIGSTDGTSQTVAAAAPSSVTQSFKQSSSSSSYSINNVDFRRGDGGVGRIVIDLSSSSIPINLREQGGKVVVDFSDTSLPSNLSKRWDVVDFSTPVQSFETFADGDNTRIVITPDTSKEFEHLAYQSDNKYVVEIREIPDEVVQQRKKEVFEGERLSLNFQDIEVRSVLQLIADFTGLNMVVSDAVTGNLTLRLKNVPWDQALDIVLKTKGLGKRENGNVIYVAPSEEIANRERLELESLQQVAELSPLRSELMQVKYARAEDFSELLKSSDNTILSERGSVSVDERTNTLLVQDTANKLDEIRRLVEHLDVPVKQVLIESRIVTASDDFSKSLGVRFGVTNVDDRDLASGDTGDITTGNLEGIVDIINGDPLELQDSLNVDLPSFGDGLNFASVGLALAKLPFGFLVELELSAAQAENRAEIISSPRVIATNQTTARIEQGTEIPYASQTSSGATDIEFQEAVLSLEVTPQITPDNRVAMKLAITNDTVAELTVGGVPAIDTNQIETDVLVDNGQTIVLGGVHVQDRQNTVNRVPFFSDIPLFGRLFKNSFEQDNKSELLIFITPKIIDEQLSLIR